MKVVGIIPARWASTRFPGKPLASIAGRTMIARVVERARGARRLDAVIVATDHDGIARAAEGAGARVVMTDPALPSGTDRIAAAAKEIDCGWVLNVQGDEPLLPPENIDLLAAHLVANPSCRMATLRSPIDRQADLENPNVVKVVCDRFGQALYFSRSAVPHFRNRGTAFRHIGLYGYRRDYLFEFASTPEGELERIEGLEQLRALENGVAIEVLETALSSPAVDSPADAEEVERRILRDGDAPGMGE
jgi:3-deoxy-manno-octulosonate cytidylyltransferase (CMP-KDO synthetase)